MAPYPPLEVFLDEFWGILDVGGLKGLGFGNPPWKGLRSFQ